MEIVIANNSKKNELLKEASINKKILNYKIMNLKEFYNNFYGEVKKESLYFLMKEFNLNYDNASLYLKNIFTKADLIKPYYDYLVNNDLIEFSNFKFDKVTSYEALEPYIVKSLNVENIKKEIGNLSPNVYEFESQTDELTFVACDIIKNIDKINDIYICLSEDYKSEFIRIFNLFKIPFNYKESSLYSSNIIQTFIKELKINKDINVINNLPDSDLKNKLIDVLNSIYIPKEIDDTFIDLIIGTLKNIKISEKESNCVHVIDINEINDIDKHYYILGFNQGVIPKVYKDDDLISDEEKSKLGLFTSLEKNKIEKDNLKYIIKTFPNLTLSYKLKDNFNTYFKSFMINDLNLNIIKKEVEDLNYSNDYNKLKLGIYLDNYFNYNEKNSNLDLLYNNYETNYKTYNNSYKKINRDSKLLLSYTSLNNYALCPFKYYIKHVLKLEEYVETFPILIGNLYHYIFSKMYEKDFDIKKTYDEFLNGKELSSKEKFYLDKLYNVLVKDIEVIKSQDNKSKYNKHLTEKEIIIDINDSVKFKGIVDKINFNNDDIVIIDYKTGSISASLDNINYGLNMQLPIYVYLVSNVFKSNINGFYLQKVLSKLPIDSDESEYKNNLKLLGYTIDDENKIKDIDNTYENSEVISGMKKSNNGFYSYTKLISNDELTKLKKITSDNINKISKNILNNEFDIKPKRINGVNVSCTYCPFSDLCFKKEEDFVNLKDTKFKEIVGD